MDARCGGTGLGRARERALGANYDMISERLGAKDDPPKGLLMHSAGHTGGGFRIFEVWETQADFDVFIVERLMPILRETTGSVSTPPQVTITSCATTSRPEARQGTTFAGVRPRGGRRGGR